MFYSEAAILDFSAGASRYVSCSLFKSKEADYVLVFMSLLPPPLYFEWNGLCTTLQLDNKVRREGRAAEFESDAEANNHSC